MGRRGGLAGMFAAIAGATVNAAFRAARQTETERNRQIRTAESDRQRQIHAEESEKRKIGKSAQRLANEANKSIKIARRTPNLTTKLHKLYAAQHIIEQLKNMANMYSYLTLYDIFTIESEIMQMQAETERNLQNIKIEKTTLAAEKRQRDRDLKNERQQLQAEKLAEKKIKDKLAQQKKLERQKLADTRSKEKVRIEADKIKEKQAKKEGRDKLVLQKELERQKLADIRAKVKARIEANKIKEKQVKKESSDKLARQKELERQKLADIRAKEKARIEANKIKEKLAEKKIKDKLAQQKELERQKLADERKREKAYIAANKSAIKHAEKARKDKLRVSLDQASIKAKRAETVAISAILKNIFSEDVPVPPQTAASESTATEVSIAGLDAESFSFMQVLASKHIWARDELKKLADHHSLMLDGTLDSINDASYDHFGGPFFEGDDPIEINTEIAKEIAV